MATTTKKRVKNRKRLTPEERKIAAAVAKQKKIERKYRTDVKSIFLNAGFSSIKTEHVQFNFKGRTGEVDSLYVYENVIVVCEDTFARKPSDHLLKKKILFDLISQHTSEFVNFLIQTFDEFKSFHQAKAIFQPHHYEIRIAYCSRYAIPEEALNQCKEVFIFDYPRFRYFVSLGKITGKTSRFEIFKFFKLEYSKIGLMRVQGGLSQGNRGYEGFLLPESNSNYPTGYKVLSFYVDPETLLQKSYVLRKDSWQDPDSAYQRMLEPKKIRSMRKYLNDTKRVYVNNLIVTLPSTTTFLSPDTKKQLSTEQLLENQHVIIHLPDEFNSIGLIDGQHRVYSYHEGTDIHEQTISHLRKCQNLLITAIMYPEETSDHDRTKFEATLFLEINDEQTKARGDLKQAIELIVRPFSTTAISKAIISQLAKRGPLSGVLEEHYFDEEFKIKTSSIVSYGLKPLVKFEGVDSLMKVWSHADKADITNQRNKPLLNEYIKFCVSQINELLIAIKLNVKDDQWSRESEGCILSPTTINGFIVCLRELVKADLIQDSKSYQQKLIGIDRFDFSSYKSSHWKALGVALFTQFFANPSSASKSLEQG